MFRVNYFSAPRVLVIIGVLALFGLVWAPTTRALTLIPPSVEISLTPGQTTTTVIKLYNETQNKLQLYTEVRDFTAKGETGQPSYDFTGDPTGFSSWVSLPKGPIDLEPGQRTEIPITVSVPTNADPGGHYASVFFGSTPPGDGQVKISSKLGTLLLGKVAGAVEEQGSVSEFGFVTGKTFYTRPPVDFFFRFNNSGNVHLRPTGTITIKNMFGSTVDSFEVNPSLGATLPNSIRRYEATWEKRPITQTSGSFIGKFFSEYKNEWNNFAIGKYTAQLSLTISSAKSGGSASLSFWIVPWHLLIVWIIILALVIFLLIFLIKRYNAWILKKAQAPKEQKK